MENYQEALKRNREREWETTRKAIARIKRQERIDTILTIIIGSFIMAATIAILIDMPNKYHQYDVNKDGVVSPADYVAIKNYIMNK